MVLSIRGLCVAALNIPKEDFIALMMEAVSASETSIFYNDTTRRNIPEGSNVYTRRRDNMKSHGIFQVLAAGSMKIAASWDIATCSVVEEYWRF
jgi:hypothetical protein